MLRTITVMVLVAALVAGCSKLTRKNYAKLKTGMSTEEVTRLLGEPDTCSEALFVRSCQWGNENRNITVNFISGKVMLFTSRNLP